MKCKRFLSMLFAAGIVLTSSFAGVDTAWAQQAAAVQQTAEQETTWKYDGVTLKEVGKADVETGLYADRGSETSQLTVQPQEDEQVRVIIVMDGSSVVEKDAAAELNLWTRAQSGLLEAKQKRVISKIEDKVLEGEALDIKYHYTWLVNGVATEVPYGMIEEIKKISGVEDVILQPMYEVAEEGIETYTIADGEMIGREDTWASGYTGKGIKIAIIDTGLDDDHQNFQAMPQENLTEESASVETVERVLGDLNASKLYPNLTVSQVYRSNKVAFGFNYVDKSTVINHSKDSQGDHGTHVAGIAAANDLGNGEAVGVAPDAQLYVMKIFGANGGAYSEDILASLEDALKLDADVINMSLGSPAGFTSEGEKMDEIYARVSETDTILAVAAGNSTTSGVSNMWGTDTNLASNPDNSIISSPAVYQNVTSVASVENVQIKSSYFEVSGKKFGFLDGSDGLNAALSTLAGEALEYAMVDNFGQSLEDFTAADVAGKVAVVQRGITNFTAKHQLAQDAGAVACLIYNNTAGTISMGLTDGTATIPCASITLAAGECLAAAKQASPDAVFTIGESQALIPNESGGQMSDFSSWGASPNLMLEPDIAAPGGNIYSTLDGGSYGIMSGTSMATPNVAGLAALVMQYAKEAYPQMAEDELHDFVNALLLSTSTPVFYDAETGLTYSPRQQGSGLANSYNATKTTAYLSVDDDDMPKAQLYDDVEKKGVYSFTYHVNNFGADTLYYALSTNAQTEDVAEYGTYKFMATTPYALSAVTKESSRDLVYTYDYDANGRTDSHDARELYLTAKGLKAYEEGAEFRYDVDTEEGITTADVQAYLDALVGKETAALDSQVLKVAAGKTADVQVDIALSQDDKTYMDENFENGIYVEGFTYLTARSTGAVDLSMPYLGFYGDWTQAPLIDYGYYWDEGESEVSQYWNILWTSIQGTDWMPGLNPYLEEEAFDVKNITMSPNEDGITDTMEDVYISLLRNAASLEISYENAQTGEIYFDEVYDKIQKTYYVSGAGSMMPFIQAYYTSNLYGFTDRDGNVLPNDTVVLLKAKAALDYDRHASANVHDTWEVAITVDTEAPVVKNAEVIKEDGKQYLELTFYDNQKVAAVCFLNKAGAVVKAKYAVDSEPGEEVTGRYDITGYGNEFMLVLGDYAVNETYFEVETDENIPEVDDSLLYAYRVATDTIYDDSLYGWVAIDETKRNEAGNIVVQEQNSEYYMDYSLQAAEYIDGYVLAINAGGQLVRLTPGVWDDRVVIAEYGVEVKEITYDPVDQVLYGYTGGTENSYEFVKIDILTGEMTGLGTQYTWWSNRPYAMACDAWGTLYGIDSKGLLKTIDKVNGSWNDEVLLDTELTPTNVQSMVYNKEENCIYWAAFLAGDLGDLYRIDLEKDYELTLVGHLEDNPELNGLLYLEDKGFDIPEENAQSLSFEKEITQVLSGTSTDLTIVPEPWYGATGSLSWSCSDESIASVDLKGTVTGKKAGTVTITATSKEIEGLTATCEVRVIKPDSELYGFVIGSNAGIANQWIHVNSGYLKGAEAKSDLSWVTYAAAEYYNGYIYAYNDSTEFYRIDPSDYTETKLTNANTEWSMKDMAYDYSTGYMYGIATWMMDGMTYLVHVDTETGLIEKATVNPVMDEKDGMPITVAVSTEGTIYMITETGYLCEYEVGEIADGGVDGDFGVDDGIDGDFGVDDGIDGDFGVDDGIDGDFGVDDGIDGDFGVDDGIDGDFGVDGGIDDDWDGDDGFGVGGEVEAPLPMGTLTTIGATGVSHIGGLTSMTYDHNTGEMYYSYADGVNAEQLALVDRINGTSLTVGSIVGGAQIVGLYTVPDEAVLPEIPEVPVTGIMPTMTTLNMVTGMQITAPIKIQPFNATDKTIKWTVFDEDIVSVENNVVTALKKGQTAVVAEIGEQSAMFNVVVYEAAGDMKGFVVYDFMYEDTNIWSTFNDSDLSTGLGLANADEYAVDAAEYYNGKVYVYDNMNSQYLVLNAASTKYEVEKRVRLEHPDMADMAFDYSEGVMYALSCVRNVDTNTSLYAVNIEDGSYYKIGEQNVTLKALACSTDGILYGVDGAGRFYQIDKRTGAETYLFNTGYSANVYQSMTYDHNTGNLYWAQCYWDLDMGSEANLILVDVKNKISVVLGQIGASGCQVTGLYVDPKNEIEVGQPAFERIRLSSNEMLEKGATQKLSAFAEPMSAAMSGVKFTYSSSDEAVARVDENGNITAVGAGVANITVSYEDKAAVCQVTVMDDATELYVFNANGYETSPVLKPSKINRKMNLSEHETELKIAKATVNTDGYFYAVGEDGYLWKFTGDMLQSEKIGEKPLLEQLDNMEDFLYYDEPTFTLRGLTANVFSGRLYALVHVIDSWSNYATYLYEVNPQTGEAAAVMRVPDDVTLPTAMTFDAEDSMIVYDGNLDYFYRVSMVSGAVEPLVWAQGTVVATEDIGMYYSASLNRVFMTTTDDSPFNDVHTIDLYVLNMATKAFEKLGQAAYNQDVKGLVMLEGIQPAEGVAATVSDGDAVVVTVSGNDAE